MQSFTEVLGIRHRCSSRQVRAFMLTAVVALHSLAGVCLCAADLMVIDSFLEGDIQISFPDGDNRASEDISGYQRGAIVRSAPTGITLSASQDSSQGVLNFTFSAQTAPVEFDYYLLLSYSLLDIGDIESLAINLLDIEGSGELIVNFNHRTPISSPSSKRVAIDSPGLLYYPTELINELETGGEIGYVDLVFVARTAEFGFTLSEVLVVPEPRVVSSLLLGIGILLLKNRGRTGISSGRRA